MLNPFLHLYQQRDEYQWELKDLEALRGHEDICISPIEGALTEVYVHEMVTQC